MVIIAWNIKYIIQTQIIFGQRVFACYTYTRSHCYISEKQNEYIVIIILDWPHMGPMHSGAIDHYSHNEYIWVKINIYFVSIYIFNFKNLNENNINM